MTDTCVAIILGIVEGITEFLPVSSTGHLLIAEQWLPPQTEMFNIVIQCGAVLAVIPLFHKRFHQFLFDLNRPATRDYLTKILTAFVITGAGGFALKKAGLKLPEKLMPVAIALLVGGILFIVVENMLSRRKKDNAEPGTGDTSSVTWAIALAVAVGQLIAAVFPGASRSGTTIIFALLLGLGRPLATEFSFLVGIPTMLAAGGYSIFHAMHHPEPGAHENWKMVAIATVVAALVSFVAVKWLLRYVQTHTFIAFGWYRVMVAIAIFAWLGMHQG
jgi:undecaprenyl-diphosphatase